MTKVEEENTEQRIRETDRQQRDNERLAREKQGREKIFDQSLKQALSTKNQKKGGELAQKDQSKQQEKFRKKSIMALIQRDAPLQESSSLARRAALTRGTLLKNAQQREEGQAADARAFHHRTEKLLDDGRTESARLDFELRQEGDQDANNEDQRVEEKQTELNEESHPNALGGVDPDGRRKHGGSGGEEGTGGDKQTLGTQGVGKKAPYEPKPVNDALTKRLQEIVDGMFASASEDGRISMDIQLRGGVLEGVKLQVRTENGRVHCTFQGTSPQLSRLIAENKHVLADGLSARGLRLGTLRT
jgi:hypothetical protein